MLGFRIAVMYIGLYNWESTVSIVYKFGRVYDY